MVNPVFEVVKDFVISTASHAVGAPLGDAIYNTGVCVINTIKDEFRDKRTKRR